MVEHGFKFGIGLLGGESVKQRTRKAGYDAGIATQAIVSFFARITTGKREHSDHIWMSYELSTFRNGTTRFTSQR
jgi:hypothetical protein